MIEVKHYIDGAWVDAGVDRFHSFDVMTAEPLCEAPIAGAQQVGEAVAAARRALTESGWKSGKARERSAALLTLADALHARLQAAGALIAREMGKALRISVWREVEDACDKLRYYAGAARLLDGRISGSTADEIWDMQVPEPVGVCGLIIPWNDPIDLAVRKLGAALAAGCTFVLKSSEVTPASTALLFEAIHDCAAFPPGVCNLVHGPGDPTGEALVAHPQVDHISFTGSSRTGMSIMESAARRMAGVSLECGGKLPAIVYPDAALEQVMDALTYGAFMYAGQSCTACTRLIAHASVHDRLVEGLVERASDLPVGDPMAPGTVVGPLASRAQFDKVRDLIRSGIADGAVAAIGGDPGAREDPLFVAPTILTGVSPQSRVTGEEIFGPVLAVYPFDEEDEAIALANATRYGLGGSVWTQDISRALRTVRRMDMADIWVNTQYVRNVETPYGGRHQSGIGRELGMAGVESYVSWKRVCIDTRDFYHLKPWFASQG